MKTYSLGQVLAEEKKLIRSRRQKLFGEASAKRLDENTFGIALSGGGIRSATINLGFLKTLNLFRILEKADYISTVSGGGYTGAYVQAMLKELDGYDKLFHEDQISHLRSYGDYLIPGQGKWMKLWNTLLLMFGFLVSWVMSLLSPAVVVAIVYLLFKAVASLSFLDIQGSMLDWNVPGNRVSVVLVPLLWILGGTLVLHFFLNLLFNFSLSVSKAFTRIESFLGLVVLLFLLVVGIITMDTSDEWTRSQSLLAVAGAFALFLFGFILNPNSLSFHRYYRKQLADAFLSHAGRYRNMLLKKVFHADDQAEHRDYIAPYPLINTCLNLQNPGGQDKFKGAKASDYFLLSPTFCGSKLSRFIRTAEFPGYTHMTLPAALTISAAAVNPGMGIYSNKLLSILMTLFNARLGFWVNNPDAGARTLFPKWTTNLVWWPSFFFKELLSKIDTRNRKLNISDGGHIENLAVYELLRRRCRLILAVDAGADPESTFADLENLSLRARNELGVDIRFRPGEDPVEIIRPKATSGYARKRFALADLMKIWEEFEVKDEQGNPVMIRKRRIEGGKIVETEEKLEALVNYFYSGNDKHFLKFRLDLKAERGIDLSEERYDALRQLAEKKVKSELQAMSDKQGSDKIKIGTLVYIKSSVTSPRKLFVPEYTSSGQKNLQFDTFKYKIYHPDFPHESTADQFFDPVQWESYFQLGQFIATDILNARKEPDSYQRGEYDFDIDDLIGRFDEGKPLFRKEEGLEGLVDMSEKEAEPAELESLIPVPKEKTEPAASIPEQIASEMQFKI